MPRPDGAFSLVATFLESYSMIPPGRKTYPLIPSRQPAEKPGPGRRPAPFPGRLSLKSPRKSAGAGLTDAISLDFAPGMQERVMES